MSTPNSATARQTNFDIAATSLEEAASKTAALFGSIYRELEKGQWHRRDPGCAARNIFDTLVDEGVVSCKPSTSRAMGATGLRWAPRIPSISAW